MPPKKQKPVKRKKQIGKFVNLKGKPWKGRGDKLVEVTSRQHTKMNQPKPKTYSTLVGGYRTANYPNGAPSKIRFMERRKKEGTIKDRKN